MVFYNYNICLGDQKKLLKDTEELNKQLDDDQLSLQERELRGQQERREQREEPPEAGPSTVRVLQSFTGQNGGSCWQRTVQRLKAWRPQMTVPKPVRMV